MINKLDKNNIDNKIRINMKEIKITLRGRFYKCL
jgi:hypothetical protein